MQKRLAGLITLAPVSTLPARASNEQVVHIVAEKTTAAFAKGQPLLETDADKIHASRREGPGLAEVHARDTDVMRYEARPDRTWSKGQVFVDITGAPGEDAIDGITVDMPGHVYVSGPGGLWVISPAGVHLGTIVTPRHVHNMAWGDADRKTLYLCARDRLYRMPLNSAGAPDTGALRTDLARER